MKKLSVILSVVLILSAVTPSFAAESDKYTSDSPNGYIVKLNETSNDSAVLMEDTGFGEVCSEAGLYYADSISDISKLGDSVEYYEPNYNVTLAEVPNDTYASRQWSIADLGVSTAWDEGFNGKGVKIAVIDSGVNSLHEDFEGTNFGNGINVMDGSHDVTDEMGHGTFVCGVLGAARNNGEGIAGFCTDATIIPIKCFGKSAETSASYIISAVYEAVDIYGCDVINMSLGMEQDMVSMKEAVQYATNKGVLIVSAVGNKGISKLNYPAAYDCVVGVGSVDKYGQVPSFSQKNQSVFVVAPGVGIMSLSYMSDDLYAQGDGTSYSTPFVSVAAVILKQYVPSATCNDFKAILQSSAIDGGVEGYDTSYGYGRLNISNFIASMKAYDFGDIGDVFSDVKGHWAAQSIEFCVRNKLFTGITSSSFAPETIMNRAMFVTVLSRISGETISGFPNSFTDVPSNEWYTQPCAWGASTGIASGTGTGTFDPLGTVTREQMAVFLYRYATLYGLTDGAYDAGALSAFTDSRKVSSWATDAMAWAVGNGLITGRSVSKLCPQESAKRCEVATIISRFGNKFASKTQ